MSLFDYEKPEEFLLFVRNIQNTLASMVTIKTKAKVQYICTLVRGEVLRKVYLISVDMRNIETTLEVNFLLKGLAWYPPPVNLLSKKKRAMHHCMKNPRLLKVRRYTVHEIDLNEYLSSFPGATMADKMGVTELNETLLNSIPNICSKKVYVQGFYCETIPLKKYVNVFESIETA